MPAPATIGDDGSITGGRWSARNAAVVRFPHILDAVNGSGDVAYINDSGQTFVARPTASSTDRCPGYNTVYYLFERGSAYDAGGDRDYASVVQSCGRAAPADAQPRWRDRAARTSPPGAVQGGFLASAPVVGGYIGSQVYC